MVEERVVGDAWVWIARPGRGIGGEYSGRLTMARSRLRACDICLLGTAAKRAAPNITI